MSADSSAAQSATVAARKADCPIKNDLLSSSAAWDLPEWLNAEVTTTELEWTPRGEKSQRGDRGKRGAQARLARIRRAVRSLGEDVRKKREAGDHQGVIMPALVPPLGVTDMGLTNQVLGKLVDDDEHPAFMATSFTGGAMDNASDLESLFDGRLDNAKVADALEEEVTIIVDHMFRNQQPTDRVERKPTRDSMLLDDLEDFEVVPMDLSIPPGMLEDRVQDKAEKLSVLDELVGSIELDGVGLRLVAYAEGCILLQCSVLKEVAALLGTMDERLLLELKRKLAKRGVLCVRSFDERLLICLAETAEQQAKHADELAQFGATRTPSPDSPTNLDLLFLLECDSEVTARVAERHHMRLQKLLLTMLLEHEGTALDAHPQTHQWLIRRERRQRVLYAADKALVASYTRGIASGFAQWEMVDIDGAGYDDESDGSSSLVSSLLSASRELTRSPQCTMNVNLDATTCVSESLYPSLAPSISGSIVPSAVPSIPQSVVNGADPSLAPNGEVTGRDTPSWLGESLLPMDDDHVQVESFAPIAGAHAVAAHAAARAVREAHQRDPATLLKPRAPTVNDLANGPETNASERDVSCHDTTSMLKLNDMLSEAPLRLQVEGDQPFCCKVSIGDVQRGMTTAQLLEQSYRNESGYACDVNGENIWHQQYAPPYPVHTLAAMPAEQLVGETISFFGSTTGGLIDALARADLAKKARVGPTDTNEQLGGSRVAAQLSAKLAAWLEGKEAYLFNGAELGKCVDWEALPAGLDRSWRALVAHVRTEPSLPHVGADYVVLVAAAHVLAPIVLYAEDRDAVRFITDDHLPGGYEVAAHLSPSDEWIRLGRLPGGHFVTTRAVLTNAEALVSKLDMEEARRRQNGKSDAEPAAYLAGGMQVGTSLTHGVTLIGDTGVGKSTFTHALAGARMYLDGRQVRVFKSDVIPDSKIGTGKASCTRYVATTYLPTGSKRTRAFKLMDNPGQFDTGGSVCPRSMFIFLRAMDEVVNAAAIRHEMAHCDSLRIVLLVHESDIKQKANGFVETLEAFKRLFVDFEDASKHVLVIITPHRSTESEDNLSFTEINEELKAIARDRPDHRESVNTLLRQCSPDQKEPGANPLMTIPYEKKLADGALRELIISELEDPSNVGEERRMYTVSFNTKAVIDRLLQMVPMDSPKDKCGLALTDKTIADVDLYAHELRDQCQEKCCRQQLDIGAVGRLLNTLASLASHLSAEAEAGGRIDAHYKYATDTIVAPFLVRSCHARMQALLQAVHSADVKPIIEDLSTLHGFCWAWECATKARELAARHLKAIHSPVPTPESLHEELVESVRALCDKAANFEASLDAVADRALLEGLRHVLSKLKALIAFFSRAQHGGAFDETVVVPLTSMLTQLKRTIVEHVINHGMAVQEIIKTTQKAIHAAATSAPTTRHDEPPSALLVQPFTDAAAELSFILEADFTLREHVPMVNGLYRKSRDALRKKMTLEATQATERITHHTSPGIAAWHELRASVLFLLRARSSHELSQHFGRKDETTTLDNLYEGVVTKIVEWHAAIAKPVLESADCPRPDDFIMQLTDHRTAIETAKALAQLSEIEQTDGLRCTGSPQWRAEGGLVDVHEKLHHLVSIRLEVFVNAAVGKLENLDEAQHSYAVHAINLRVLEGTVWWDSLTGGHEVKDAVGKFEEAFLSRATALKVSISEKIHLTDYEGLKVLLDRLHEMSPLWEGRGEDDARAMRFQREFAAATAAVVQHAEAAHHAIEEKVLARATPPSYLSLSDPPRVDASVYEGFRDVDLFLNLADHLVDPQLAWLGLSADVGKKRYECRRLVIEEFRRMRQRVANTLSALAEGSSIKSIDDALAFADPEEIKDVLSFFVHQKLPHVFATRRSAYNDSDGEGNEEDVLDLPDFRELEHHFTYDCMKRIDLHFEEFPLDVQKRLLAVLTDLNAKLPSRRDKIFSGLKKLMEDRLERLARANNKTRDDYSEKAGLKFLANEYTAETHRLMEELRASQHRRAYERAQEKLTDSFGRLSLKLRQGFVLMQHNENGFAMKDAQEAITTPWMQYEAAMTTGHEQFLQPTNSDVSKPMDLAKQLQELRELFTTEFTKMVQKQVHVQFETGELVHAEKGLQWAVRLDSSLQMAGCKALHEITAKTLDAEHQYAIGLLRSPLKAWSGVEYAKLLEARMPVQDSGDPPLLVSTSSSPVVREGVFFSFLKIQMRLFTQLQQVSTYVHTELKSTYINAKDEIQSEVSRLVRAELAPALRTASGDNSCGQQVDMARLEFYERLVKRMRATDSLETFHDGLSQDLHNAELGIFALKQSIWISDCDFDEMGGERQGEALLRFPTYTQRYFELLERYRICTAQTVKLVAELVSPERSELKTHTELSDAVFQMRSRVAHYANFPQAAALNLKPMEQNELMLAMQAKELHDALMQELSSPPEQPEDMLLMKRTLRKFVDVIRSLLGSVPLQPPPVTADSSPSTSSAAEVPVPADNSPPTSSAAEVPLPESVSPIPPSHELPVAGKSADFGASGVVVEKADLQEAVRALRHDGMVKSAADAYDMLTAKGIDTSKSAVKKAWAEAGRTLSEAHAESFASWLSSMIRWPAKEEEQTGAREEEKQADGCAPVVDPTVDDDEQDDGAGVLLPTQRPRKATAAPETPSVPEVPPVAVHTAPPLPSTPSPSPPPPSSPPPATRGRSSPSMPPSAFARGQTERYTQLVSSVCPEALSFGQGVFDVLIKCLEGDMASLIKEPSIPMDLAHTKLSLERLHAWQSMMGDRGVVELAHDLEMLLTAGDAPQASKVLQQLGESQSHQTRLMSVQKTVAKTVKAARKQVDAKVVDGKPLERDAYELIVSPEMRELVKYMSAQNLRLNISKDISGLVDLVKSRVDAATSELVKALNETDYDLASSAHQRFQYFDNLLEMDAFDLKTYEDQVKQNLIGHVNGLYEGARQELLSSNEGKQMARWILKLKKFTNAFPSEAIPARSAQDSLLYLTKEKLNLSGMKSLANALRSMGGGLGNEVVNEAHAFRAITVEEFNNKTYLDSSKLHERLKELNPDMTPADFEKLAKQVELFQKTNAEDIQKCFKGVSSIRTCMLALIDDAKTRVKECKKGISYQPVKSANPLAAAWGSTAGAVHTVGTAIQAALTHNTSASALKQAELPKVLAAVFAWWTMEFYNETHSKDEELDMNRVRKPHEMQIICMLRMLGVVKKDQIVSHLSEIFTGQGKSVVLAVTAVTLALFGYHVDVVCYSKALSERDREIFSTMFAAFGVVDKIRYKTFEQLVQALIDEKYGKVRDIVREFLSKGTIPATKASAVEVERILEIDEVDVLLHPDLFSGTYRPNAQIGGSEVSALLKYLWQHPNESLDLIQKNRLYTVVLERSVIAPVNEWFLKSAVIQMQRATQDFWAKQPRRNVDYLISDDGWVMYKLQDRTVRSDEMSYSYATNCIYLYEHDQGKISEGQLQERGLLFHAICGEFSYAMLPQTGKFYKSVLGTTGTLSKERLPEQEMTLLKDEIGIEQFTFCASMYRENTLEFSSASKDDMQMLSDWNNQACAIAEEIKRRLKPTVKAEGERAVIVFFSSIEELDRFCASSYSKFLKDINTPSGFKTTVDRLTEASASRSAERKAIIERATRPGHVTLATSAFCRGVDFKVLDDHLLMCGGMHVLSTFFPADKSEEVQMKGRTARQGDAGSFSMVLRVEQLVDCCSGLTAEKLKECVGVTAVEKESLEKWDQEKALYAKLDRIRMETSKLGLETRLKLAAEAMETHKSVVKALSDKTQLGNLLRRSNQVNATKVTRTLILIDITNSMRTTIEATKARVGEFFDRCQKVLTDEDIHEGFELQVAGYSNYNVKASDILEASTWEEKPANLRTFLEKLEVRGGRGNEAIEVGLMHALSEHKTDRPITQIVLIGDAGPNTLDELREKRKVCGFGEAYWQSVSTSWCPDGVPAKTAGAMLVDLAKEAGQPPPIYAYYLKNYAKESFETLAAQSKGKAEFLDINDPKGAEMLTDAVCTKILKGIGGDRLEKAYERMKASFG